MENDRCDESLKLFETMPLKANVFTLSILFKICSKLSDEKSFRLAKNVWKSLSMSEQKNSIVSTSYLNFLSKRDRIDQCEKQYFQMVKNPTAQTILIDGSLMRKRHFVHICLFSLSFK